MSLRAAEMAGLDASEAAERLRAGDFSAADYARALLERVDAVEPQVRAWAHLDRAYLLRQAEAADHARAAGEAMGPLFGLPVGLKDIIDTADLPTENGCALHAGRQPASDAWLVRALRAAGAIVMGKTVTTELATYAPGPTRNPHDLAHTPGGSSSGSAAAVAARMVPLAVGTQTNGSMIRPASFCGVFGYKPSAGWIPRSGVLTQSPSFDCIGVFGRSLADLALLAEPLIGHDPPDPATRPRATPPLRAFAAARPPWPPTLAWVPTPWWDRVAPDAQAAFAALVGRLARHVEPLELPPEAGQAVGWHRLVMEAEIAGSFAREYERGREQLSESLRGQIERGRTVSAVAHRAALAQVPLLRAALDAGFDRFDALLTPATLGTAPAGLASTGDPIMCTLWSFLGLPALSLPLLRGAGGLPIGVQLVGRHGDDARLLRCAGWLVDAVGAQSG
ncbi:MAG: amidase [Burkholderiales bacterium]|nr:amidase [Burkholderiales bacterium]